MLRIIGTPNGRGGPRDGQLGVLVQDRPARRSARSRIGDGQALPQDLDAQVAPRYVAEDIAGRADSGGTPRGWPASCPRTRPRRPRSRRPSRLSTEPGLALELLDRDGQLRSLADQPRLVDLHLPSQARGPARGGIAHDHPPLPAAAEIGVGPRRRPARHSPAIQIPPVSSWRTVVRRIKSVVGACFEPDQDGRPRPLRLKTADL